MGLLHHARYLTYFEIGRTEMLRAAGGRYRQMEEDGWYAVVVKVECNYRGPARYDDLLTVRTTLERVTAAKIIHSYELLRDEEMLATARVTLALVNRDGVVQRIPSWLAEASQEDA